MKIHYLQHVPFEGLGRIQDWADAHKHPVSVTRLFTDDALPSMESFDFLAILGGPMGADDDHHLKWLSKEKAFIEAALERNKTILGICLGAQLIARVLGARVYPNREKEIGWFPIELDPPAVRDMALNVLSQRHMVFHWHGDTFDLPKGARHLARSQACENQAFSLDRNVLGLQFHLEMAEPQIETMIQHGREELGEGAFIQSPREMMELAHRYGSPLSASLFRFLDAFTKGILAPSVPS